MIRGQIMDRGIRDARVVQAMRDIPREKFFPADSQDAAYTDQAHPIGHGQTISQPYIVALMTWKLNLENSHKVLEIGTGSGYQTAILARLAGEVYTMELVKPLLDAAWERLMSMSARNIHFRHGDGTLGWPQAAPFDRILIAAAGPVIPRELLLSHLAPGGEAVLPVGERDDQMLIHVRRDGDQLKLTDLCRCRFVDFVGAVK